MFKKFIKWLIGEDTESKYAVDKEYTYKEDKVDKVDGVNEVESNKEELHIENINVDNTENEVDEVNVETKESIKDSKVSEIEDNKEFEDRNTEVGSEVKKDIKEEVESILKRRSAEGFINKNHLIIDGKRNDYLECECGGIGVVEEGIVTCTRCNKESEVV